MCVYVCVCLCVCERVFPLLFFSMSCMGRVCITAAMNLGSSQKTEGGRGEGGGEGGGEEDEPNNNTIGFASKSAGFSGAE